MSIDFDDAMDGAMEEGVGKAEELKARQLAARELVEETATQMRKEKDIVARARQLFVSGAIQYADVKKIRQGDSFVSQPLMTDQNKKLVLDSMFKDEEELPRHDLFRGRVVDHNGDIIDDHYPVLNWVEAFAAAGLKGATAKGTREFLREWAFHNKQNDLIRHVEDTMPVWDGQSRLETKLIEIFECNDTPLNRNFGKYFWLSLYARVLMPGALAPIVLSLFGAQGCGKSRFTKALSQIITGDEESDSVQLNLDGNKIDFLRDITGHSVIANIGEMTGFNRGDLNKIKEFVTRPADPMHHKFEGHFLQQRQWIAVMDGNKYEGMQRDETGNRRFYPIFCGQLPDYLGKPDWRKDFVVKDSVWETLHEDVWQIMAECAAWFEENGEGMYARFVGDVIRQVSEFSKAEMARDSGTIQDDVFEVYLVPMLKEGPKFVWTNKQGVKAVGVRTGEFKRYFMDSLRHIKPNWRHLKNKMMALGAVEHAFTGGYPGYLFPDFHTIEEFVESVGVVRDFTSDGSVEKYVPGEKPDGGF
jgi:energy-coupling factor transporter ATP-binding protein EcfA2